jgi:Uncharacterized protein conserved in bacteria (DUF2344)
VIAELLDEALPDGLDVVAVVEAGGGSLADHLEVSRWLIDLPDTPEPVLSAAADSFLAADSVAVERMTKKGLRSFDSRAAVLALTCTSYDVGSRLEVLLRHTVPSVRPDDVLSGLTHCSGLEFDGTPLVTRLEQGSYDVATGTLRDPFGASG